MTDKEWKELCDWASKQGAFIIPTEIMIKFQAIVIGIFKDGMVVIEHCDINPVYQVIAYNRTPAQIKSIIENLL